MTISFLHGVRATKFKFKVGWHLLLLLLIFDFVVSSYRIFYVPTFHLDGAFQTASGLLRFSQGEIPGKDFFPYLGASTIYLLFPLFKIAGGSLVASVFAAKFIVLVSAQITTWFISRSLTKNPRISHLAVFAITMISIPILIPEIFSYQLVQLGGPVRLLDLAIQPGNSLRPIRAFAPIFLGLLFLGAYKLKVSQFKRGIALATLTGFVAATWSNDYGLVSSASFMTVLLFEKAVGLWAIPKKIVIGFTAFLSYYFAVQVITLGHGFELMKYNFEDVRSSQFWFFGPWTEETRITSVESLQYLFTTEHIGYPLLAFGVLALRQVLRKESLFQTQLAVGASFIGGGLIASFGGHIGEYFWAAHFWALIVFVTLMANLLTRNLGFVLRIVEFITSAKVGFIVGVFSVAVVLAFARNSWYEASADESLRWDSQLGGFISRDYSELLPFAESEPIYEEYFGLASAAGAKIIAAPVDATIHALGSQQEVLRAKIEAEAQSVITTAPSMSTEWVSWNLSANWWFYKTLFAGFTPDVSSPTTVTWAKLPRKANLLGSAGDCIPTDKSLKIEVPKPGLYEIQTTQVASGGSPRAFTMLRNNLSLVSTPVGYVALDPSASQSTVPVFFRTSGLQVLDYYRIPSSSTVSKILSCSVRELILPEAINRIYSQVWAPTVASTKPVQYTDQNWVSGVSRLRAGFFIPYSDANLKKLKSSKFVRFFDGVKRKIVDYEVGPSSINIWLEGRTLDPKVYGAPRDFAWEK